MRPTSISVLVVAALLAAAAGWLLLSFFYSSWPAPPWLPVIVLAVLAFAEGFLAQCIGGRYEPVGNDFKGSSIKVLEGANNVPGLADALK